MNGHDVFAAVWRRKLVALLVLVLTLAATALYLVAAPVTYSARATLALVPPPAVAGQAALADFNSISEPLLSTLADVVVSEPVLSTAARRLSPQPTVSELRTKVVGAGLLRTLILRVESTDGNAQRAADISNAVAAAIVERNPSTRLGLLILVDPATPPGSPVSPDKKTSLAIGLILGLILAAAAAAAMDRRKLQLVRGLPDVEQVVGAPVLARLGSAGNGDQDGELGALVSRLRPQLVAGHRPVRVVIVEAEPAGGVPQLSQQLAIALYDGRTQVLALHGPDSRVPSMNGHEPSTQAMAALVSGGHLPGGAGVATSPGGPLLGTAQLRPSIHDFTVVGVASDEQVTHALSAFDIVVADSRHPVMKRHLPALFPGSRVLVVVRQGTTRRSDLQRLIKVLKDDGAAVSGVVLT